MKAMIKIQQGADIFEVPAHLPGITFRATAPLILDAARKFVRDRNKTRQHGQPEAVALAIRPA